MGTPGAITLYQESLSFTHHRVFAIILPVFLVSLSQTILGMDMLSNAVMVHTVNLEENGEPVPIMVVSHDPCIRIKE
jgi:hypothetical protein